MLGALILAGLVICTGSGDTEKIQESVVADSVTTVVGMCSVPGQPGVKIGSDRNVQLGGAVVVQGPNLPGMNRVFEFPPGTKNSRISGGMLVGSRVAVPGLLWSIGVRVDSAEDIVVEDMIVEDFFTDGMAVAGNSPGSTRVTLRGNRVSGAKRNALSLTSGTGIRVVGNVFEETNCTAPCTAADLNMPMCGIDFEPNSGESLKDVVVMDNVLRNNQKCGIFLQSNQWLGGDTLIYNNTCEGNGTWCVAANQVKNAWVIGNKAQGGTIGFTFGAGVKSLVAVKNEVAGNSGNAFVFAGVWDPFADQNKTGGKPVFYVAIQGPVKMNGVEGTVQIKGFE